MGFSTNSSACCYIDNIVVSMSGMIPDTSVVFKIDGTQVYFSENGTADNRSPARELIASGSQLMANYIQDTPEAFSYVCSKDVTALVKAFSAKAPEPAANHPGRALYAVSGVDTDTISPLGGFSPGETSYLSYAGWSLVIIYSSVETKGHCLYLYDTFMHSNGDTNIDFDSDNVSGGTISGFIVPDRIQNSDGSWEVNAARLTVFVGEGDEAYGSDSLSFNGTALWDGTTSTGTGKENSAAHPNNIWNGKSLGMTADGVDIDTCNVTWNSGLLHAGDTSARIDLPTATDEWNLIYIILAFRSKARAGGNLSYLIE